VKGAQEVGKDSQSRLKQMEDAIKDLQSAAKAPPITLPPTPTPTPLLPQPTERHVDAIAQRVIRSTTLPGAIISIIPFMPGEPQNFANQLGEAFSSIAGVQVAVGHDNFIMNGTRGLYVQYDHNNPVSVSVFNALAKAGLNPIDGTPTPGTSIVFVKVAPQ
jgi:hypothetical protein